MTRPVAHGCHCTWSTAQVSSSEIAWAETVARAAPVMPIFITMMNNQHSTILAVTGITQMAVEYRALPSARMIVEKPVLVMAPRKMIRPYAMA